ncbi:ATP-NAD kinase family protein [Agarivorans sp. 1_MG-2023]|uniref:ATP-NAD kinase family protein n=1 Tax=Agarivorans sp. 1_MG-2023 TaxID=3062634 RepID=UPI0026E1DC4F|nr:ATP-NAD kinase family protein [Agarivorans sp. 1_MG-2023]MDO6763995.1 ATP-NAD kinase family protein [Agarivorans sp. 1_MG-2023]
MIKLGLIINPIAGVGGSVALKGSDGVVEQALARGAERKANLRAEQALQQLTRLTEPFEVYTASGEMGQHLCEQLGLAYQVVYSAPEPTSAADTQQAAKAIAKLQVDLLVFAGGDGTARDVLLAVGEQVNCLGIPAGCKIHSGVYGVTPKASGLVIEKLIKGEMLSLKNADVMDIDEQAFRQGRVRAKCFGEMMVPDELRYVQAVKQGGIESEDLVLQDIAAEVIEMLADEQFIAGSGSTVAAIMQELSLPNTLLGVDLVKDHQIVQEDLTAAELINRISHVKTKLLITPIGGQGHLFGRGNQQLSPALIRKLGRDNIVVVATKTKLKSLHGRPLIVDTGDTELDKILSGSIKVITGYRDYIMYRVSNPENEVTDAQKLCHSAADLSEQSRH